jgi:hypothetical protein
MLVVFPSTVLCRAIESTAGEPLSLLPERPYPRFFEENEGLDGLQMVGFGRKWELYKKKDMLSC